MAVTVPLGRTERHASLNATGAPEASTNASAPPGNFSSTCLHKGVNCGPTTIVSKPSFLAADKRISSSISVPTITTSAPRERAEIAHSIPMMPGPLTTTRSFF